MRKARMAEWMLRQVLPPERAASTVGDLLEDAVRRSDVWFWLDVLRTSVASIWSDFAESPIRLLSVSLIGCLMAGNIFQLFWVWPPADVVFSFFSGLTGGYWIARGARGKEVAACATTCLAIPILMSILALIFTSLRSGLANLGIATILAREVPSYAGMIAGCLWQRWRTLGKPPSRNFPTQA